MTPEVLPSQQMADQNYVACMVQQLCRPVLDVPRPVLPEGSSLCPSTQNDIVCIPKDVPHRFGHSLSGRRCCRSH